MDISISLVAGAACITIAAGVLMARRRAQQRLVGDPDAGFDPHAFEPAVFVFDNRILVDATDRAAALLQKWSGASGPWQQLIAALSAKIPDIETRLTDLSRGERYDVWSSPDHTTRTHVQAEWRNGMMRITVTEADESDAAITLDAQSVFAAERDSELLRAIGNRAPLLIWKSRPDTGEVTWANQAYLDAASNIAGDAARNWPPARIFSGKDGAAAQDSVRRLSIPAGKSGDLAWFDRESHRLGSETLNFARASDAEVRAEGALREFIQTLSKTFAGLPIGLAIFNRSRRLILFNPALTDLSEVRVDFLASQPSLQAFLDEMRNRGSIPEPKDYKSWRQKILDLEAQATNGTYQETWELSGGRTFQVTGQPHPQGAVALLFQDITSATALTRRFRSDMNLAQSVLDQLPEALVVFSPTGNLTASNAAYAKLWGNDPQTTLGEISIIDATKIWMGETDPTPVWGDVRDFVGETESRAEWQADVRLTSGAYLACRFTPLSTGETMIRFEQYDVTFSTAGAPTRAKDLLPTL